MKELIAFTKKEFKEQSRSSKLMILLFVFVLFGIFNPAMAKLTPWLIENLLDSSNMSINIESVTALDSWVQFFKNIPMALMAFVLIESNIFTKEYQAGTLILSLTKGLNRSTVIISKTTVLTLIWSINYWICFGITYFYSDYYWDNSVVKNIGFAAFASWLFGLMIIALIVLFSAMSNANTSVLIGVGALVLICFMIGFIPSVAEYLPTKLLDGNSLIYGLAEAEDYFKSIAVTAGISAAGMLLSFPFMNKKHL